MCKRFPFLKYAVLVVLLMPMAVYATEHKPSIADLKWQAIDLAVFFAILLAVNFGKGNLLAKAWHARWQKKYSEMTEGAAVLSIAEERFEKINTTMENIEAEIESVKEKIKNDTNTEADAIIAAAQQKAELIIAQERATAELEKSAAEQEVRVAIVTDIIKNAAERLKVLNSYEADKVRRLESVRLLRKTGEERIGL